MSTATAATYQGTFSGRADEAARVRREITGYLQDCPATEDIVLIAHELAANAILHSRSRGGSFAVRCELTPRAARVEVEDMGGPSRPRKPDDPPHGLDIVGHRQPAALPVRRLTGAARISTRRDWLNGVPVATDAA